MADSEPPGDLPRRPKGQRPYYFDDPAVDQLYAAHLALATELAVALDRLDALERVLERGGRLERRDVEEFVPDATAAVERDRRRGALVERLLRPFVDYRDSLFAAGGAADRRAVNADDAAEP